jgi:hypothetical protein
MSAASGGGADDPLADTDAADLLISILMEVMLGSIR